MVGTVAVIGAVVVLLTVAVVGVRIVCRKVSVFERSTVKGDMHGVACACDVVGVAVVVVVVVVIVLYCGCCCCWWWG